MTRQHATNLEFFHIHSSIDNAALERSRVVYTKRKKENESVIFWWGVGVKEKIQTGLSGRLPGSIFKYHFILNFPSADGVV